MREQIADVLHESTMMGYPACKIGASAIIAALPGMVKPLVWEKHPVGIMASTGQGTSYIVDDRQFRPRFIKWPSGNFAPDIRSLVDAKAAAQADHTVRIMQALGVTEGDG